MAGNFILKLNKKISHCENFSHLIFLFETMRVELFDTKMCNKVLVFEIISTKVRFDVEMKIHHDGSYNMKWKKYFCSSISLICNFKFLNRYRTMNAVNRQRKKIKQKPFRLPLKLFHQWCSASILQIFIFDEVSRYQISIFSQAQRKHISRSIYD